MHADISCSKASQQIRQEEHAKVDLACMHTYIHTFICMQICHAQRLHSRHRKRSAWGDQETQTSGVCVYMYVCVWGDQEAQTGCLYVCMYACINAHVRQKQSIQTSVFMYVRTVLCTHAYMHEYTYAHNIHKHIHTDTAHTHRRPKKIAKVA
jgi:hypothetical protein